MVDISRISYEDLEFKSYGAKRKVNAHRPFLICNESVKYAEYYNSLFRVHHYLGNWEAYSARSDTRRGREIFDERNNPNHVRGPSYDAQPWFRKFVHSVGKDAAVRLLQGAGGEYGYGKRYKEPETPSLPFSCALLFYGYLPETRYTGIIISSIQTNILDIHPSCDVYVHTYSETMSEELLLPMSKANPLQRSSSNVVLDSASVLKANYPDYLGGNAHPLTSLASKWHSIQRVWDCMVQAEDKDLGRQYDVVGMFRLDARYMHRIPFDQDANLNPLVISKQVLSSKAVDGLNSRVVYGQRQHVKVWAADRFPSATEFLKMSNMESKIRKRNLGTYFTQNIDKFSDYCFHVKNNISIRVKEDICVHGINSKGDIVIGDCRCRELHEFMTGLDKQEDRVAEDLGLTASNQFR